jgi:hypothetical protein
VSAEGSPVAWVEQRESHRFATTRDAWADWQFLAWNVGVLITAIGAVTRTLGHGDAVIAIGSIVLLAAALMLLVIFQRSAK